MRIAHVSLLTDLAVPGPSNNAGRAANYLIEELIRSHHEVTLFAGVQWDTSAQLVRRFDLVHFHCNRPNLPPLGDVDVPCVLTVHAPCEISGRLGTWDTTLIPTSHRQLLTSGAGNVRAPIPHGLPSTLYALCEQPGSYLAYNGPIFHESGVQSAVEIARHSGSALKMTCAITSQDRGYFSELFVPMLRASPHVQWTGDLDDSGRNRLLGGACALLAPDDRSGAYEMQIIEALACGTPVIAWANTAAADIVEDGMTGFVVRSSDEAIAAIARVSSLDRRACRRSFEERFDMRVIAGQYCELYASTVHAYQAAAVTVESCRRERPLQAPPHP